MPKQAKAKRDSVINQQNYKITKDNQLPQIFGHMPFINWKLQENEINHVMSIMGRDKNVCDVLVHRKTDTILGQKEENCVCDVCESIIKDTISDTKGKKILQCG